MLQSCREPDLPLEALGRKGRPLIRREDLDHDVAAEARLLGDEDARHPAPTQLAVDAVRLAEGGLEAVAEV
jgi:hypothetical protein